MPVQHSSSATLAGRLGWLRIRHLHLLDRIQALGSLSAAAGAIGVSQPAATLLLRELEDAFGVPLVERMRTGGQLNAAGIQVHERLRVALNALMAAKAAAVAAPAPPLVRIGMLPLVGIELLPSVVSRLEKSGDLPRIDVQLGTVGSLTKMLSDGLVDCLVSSLDDEIAPAQVGRFRTTPLWNEGLAIIAALGHPLLSRPSLGLTELHNETWILTPQGSRNRRLLDSFFTRAGLESPPSHIETNSFHICVELAARSRLLTAVPESALQAYTDRVCQLPVRTDIPSGWLSFITLKEIQPPAAVLTLEAAFRASAKEVGRQDRSLRAGKARTGDG